MQLIKILKAYFIRFHIILFVVGAIKQKFNFSMEEMSIIWPPVHDSILSKRRNQGKTLKGNAPQSKMKLKKILFYKLFIDFYFVVFSDESTSNASTSQAGNHKNDGRQDATDEDERQGETDEDEQQGGTDEDEHTF